MINPFALPAADGDTYGSLCPWRDEIHLNYYVSVDNTEQAFQSFKTELTAWRGHLAHRIVLIYGDDGCGKTSLANRCAHAIKKHHPNLHILQLPNATGPVLRTAQQKAHYALMTMLDSLEYVSNFLDDKELQSLKALADDERIAQRLETILSQGGGGQQRRALVVIQPGLETSSDLDGIVALLRRKNIVLILETTFGEVYDRSNVASRVGAPSQILRLKVGQLQQEDCVNYVRERLGDQAFVEIPEAIIRRFTAARTDRTDGLSIREFERICAYLYGVAADRAEKRAVYDDIADYYARYGKL